MHAAPVAGFAAPGHHRGGIRHVRDPGGAPCTTATSPPAARERLVTALTDDDAVAKLLTIDPSSSGRTPPWAICGPG